MVATQTPEPTADVARLVMTPAEVAEALGKNLNELYGMFQRGEAPFPVRKLGRKWVVPTASFMRWLEGDAGQPDAA